MQLLLCTVKWFKVQTNGEFDWKGFDKDQRFESDTTWKCQRRKTQKEAKPWPSRWAFQDQPPPPTEIKSKVGCVGICSVWRRWTFSSSYAHFQAFFFSGGPGCGRCGVRRSVWRCLKAKNLSCLLLLLHDLFSVRRHNKSIFWGLIEPRRVFFRYVIIDCCGVQGWRFGGASDTACGSRGWCGFQSILSLLKLLKLLLRSLIEMLSEISTGIKKDKSD